MRTELAVFFAVLAAALLSMGVFAASGARRGRDRLESPARGSFVLGAFARSWFYWFIRPVERLSLAVGATPFFYNMLGLVLAVAAGVALALGRVPLGGWLILLGGIADSLDGRVARATGVASAKGAFIDSTLDRFAELAAFTGLAVLFRHDPVVGPLAVAGLGGSLLVSYTRARGASLGIDCNLGVMQRTERLLLLGLGSILDPSVSALLGRGGPGGLLLPILALIAVGTIGTAAFRTVWIVRRLDAEPPRR